jgi:hypothetical protein
MEVERKCLELSEVFTEEEARRSRKCPGRAEEEGKLTGEAACGSKC